MTGGYIKLHRKVMESEIWNKPPYFFKLWTFILMKANYAEDDRLEPGECLVTMRELQDAGAYFAGYRKKPLSRKQIWLFLTFIGGNNGGNHGGATEEPMAELREEHGRYRIKVHKYGVYQGSETYGGTTEGTMEGTTEEPRKEQRENSPSLYRKKERRKKKEYVSPYIPQEGDTENNSYHDVVPFWDPNPAEEPTEEETAAFYARHRKG